MRRRSGTPQSQLTRFVEKSQLISEGETQNMSSTSRAWIVAASVGAVEALKDQGICRWNHAFRSLQQQAKKGIRSYAHAKSLSPAVTSTLQKNVDGQERLKQSEESLRKVMYLSCWGPN